MKYHSFGAMLACSFVIMLATAGYFTLLRPMPKEVAPTPRYTACTKEAKVCPDGSSVGRVLPSCEFAACLTANPPTSKLSLQDIREEEQRLAVLNRNRTYPSPDGIDPRVLGTYRGRTVEVMYICFGDVCPQNGGWFVRYQSIESKEACEAIGGKPILGVSWGSVYGGCGVK